jgi:hypothetical protein
MKVRSLFIVVFFLFLVVNMAQAAQDDWSKDYKNPRDLQITEVTINQASCSVDEFKKSSNSTLGGPGSGPGLSNYLTDAYTAPTWATTLPSSCTIEQYQFYGGSAATIDHRVLVFNNAGPWPTPLSLAFAWQRCGNGVLFPPLPLLLGTTLDGITLFLTLPFNTACCPWYVTVGISGFSPDTVGDGKGSGRPWCFRLDP